MHSKSEVQVTKPKIRRADLVVGAHQGDEDGWGNVVNNLKIDQRSVQTKIEGRQHDILKG